MFYQGKHVLVTGGTGFIGSHIVEELLKYGARVRVPIHKRPMRIKDKRLDFVRADFTKEKDCLTAVQGIDYVFHAAGGVGAASTGHAHAMEGIVSNLILTVGVLRAVLGSGVERFLLFSSSTVYPAADHPVKENEAWFGAVHPSYAGYGWMRRYFEKLGVFIARQSRVKISILRPAAVYGEWDNFNPSSSHVIAALIRRAVEKRDPFEVWGSGEEVRDFLHVRDLARACLLAIEKSVDCDPVNIGSGEGIKIKELAAIILNAAGYPQARVIFNNEKPTMIPFRMVDISKAKKLLGFQPHVKLKTGIEDLLKWYIKNRLFSKKYFF